VGTEEAALDQPRRGDQADRAGADHDGEEHARNRGAAGQGCEPIHGWGLRRERRRQNASRPPPPRQRLSAGSLTEARQRLIEEIPCSKPPVAASSLAGHIDAAAKEIESRVIAWRRDIHANPELGNREFRTAGIVAEHLKQLGLDEVRTGVAHTGVVGLLKGALPGPVVALRADMDALPVAEEVDIPFASKVKAQWNGESVGVMHACGHDAHVAILMGVAEVLAGLRRTLRGSVKFIFQPAEELPPEGEEGGAKMMVAEARSRSPCRRRCSACTSPRGCRSACSATGRDRPWRAPIRSASRSTAGRPTARCRGSASTRSSPAAQVVLGLQTVVSRQVDLTREPAVVTVGMIKGGVRQNIIPDSVEMRGTIRSFDEEMRDDIHERVTILSEGIARGRARAAASASPRTIRSRSTTRR
jgi:amidohydrolase